MTDATAVLEAAGDGIAVVAADGQVEWANRRLLELLGAGEAAAAGDALHRLAALPPAAAEHRAHLETAAGEVAVTVAARPLADGRWVVQVRDLRPWLGPPRARSTTREAGIERALGRVLGGALLTAGVEFEGEERPEVIAHVLAEQGRRLIPGAECLIAVVDAGRPDRFRVAGGAGPWASRLVGQDFVLEGSLVGRALPTGRVLETSQTESSVLSSVLAGGGIRTVRLVPVTSQQPLPDGRTALGTVGFYSSREKPFTEGQRRLMDDFASLVGLSLIRAALRRAVRVATERLEIGVELAVELGRSLDVREVVGRLLERMLDALDTDRAVLLRIAGDDTVTEDARDRLGLPDVLGYRHPIDQQPLMRQAVRTRLPVVGGRYLGGQLPGALRSALGDVRHTLTVPLVLDGEAVAVLVLSRRRDAAFRPDDVATVRLLSSLAVLALRNAWLYAEAQEASRLRSDFLNMAAHELRTPFTVVAGYLSMLQEGSLGEPPPGWRQPLATLEAKAAELGRLVEDLLLASRLDTGTVPALTEVVDMNRVASDAIARAAPRAHLLAADLALDAADAATLAVADREHADRILDNLVNNALTYSRGTPWVRLRVRRTRGGVRVEVEDRGRGIAPEAAELVFERFYRVDGDGQSPQSGTGLGLYISRELATRQGGRLELEWSRAGEGSRFVLTLPAAPPEV